MKKALALILALVLCLGVLAGCEKKPAETTPAATTKPAETKPGETQPVATEAPAYSMEGKELHIICGHDINDLPLDKFVEEATGLSVKWTPHPGADAVTAMMTDKVTPDLLNCMGANWNNQYGRYGVIVNLYEYRDILPNFFKYYDSYGDEIKKHFEIDGELYSAPVFLNGDVQHYGWYYREDVFKELNLTAPTTWDEFLAVCKALKEAYPDCYPFTARNLTGGLGFFTEFAQQFGVDYTNYAIDRSTGKVYNAFTTDNARQMLTKMRELIDLGYMDVATLANDTAMWVADLSSGKSFITHDKAFQLTNLEKAGKEVNPDFSLAWWHNMEVIDNPAVPHQCRDTYDWCSNYYTWSVPTKAADVELALHYLDWMYSDEGSLILSWGKEGESYGVDADGNKYFLEGYDATFQARYQESGYIDMKGTAATYTPKCQDMIFDTMAAAREGGWYAISAPLNAEEQKVVDTYGTDYLNVKHTYYQKFLLGDLEINDANWEKLKAEMASFGEAELLAAYQSAYDRLIGQ